MNAHINWDRRLSLKDVKINSWIVFYFIPIDKFPTMLIYSILINSMNRHLIIPLSHMANTRVTLSLAKKKKWIEFNLANNLDSIESQNLLCNRKILEILQINHSKQNERVETEILDSFQYISHLVFDST